MKKIAAGITLAAALAAGGAVYAQGAMRGGDGVSTRAEAQAKAEEHFTKRDANRDGKIDAADRQAHHAAMFDRMDADKNGQLSRAEFMAMHAMRQGMRGARDADHHAMGEDHGGGHRMGMGGGGRRGGMMRMADANRDGAITREEFMTTTLARFDRGDANRDGTLTAEERRASRGTMRSGRSGSRSNDNSLAMPPSEASGATDGE